MTPAEEGAAILTHYFKTLAHESGRTWSQANSRDILRAVCLIASDTPSDEPQPANTIPAYHPATAKTVTMRRESTADDKEWLRKVAQNGGK